jgi:hypothetical protein
MFPFGMWDLVLTCTSQGFEGRSVMRVYRCYFLNERDGIEGYENIEAHALHEAIDRALALLPEQPKHHKAIEIWDGPHRLYPARKRRPGRSRIFVSNQSRAD